MKQILQRLDNGDIELAEVPVPRVGRGQVLVRTQASVISIGTERMLLEFGRASFLGKVRQQPEKVRQVVNKIRTDGLAPTLQAVRAKLEAPLPLGYSNAGEVVEIGPGVTEFAVGDRVVSNGPHAHFVCVPVNLCAKIPDGPNPPTFEAAAFTVVAAIGLQGIRLAAPTLGETFVVTGLGLIGLLTAQLLQLHGCRVLGIDLDARKVALARQLGLEAIDVSAGADPVATALALTGGRGVDGVLLTASTPSSEPARQAARMCRKRGRVVQVGVTGMDLARPDFYEKELSFQVSCSYGPGRYDQAYEQQGHDYPYGYVRWTEKRNFEAILDLLAQGRLDPTPIITHRANIDDAPRTYATLAEDRHVLGVVLKYPTADTPNAPVPTQRVIPLSSGRGSASSPERLRIGVIGAGNFTTQVVVPALVAAGAELRTIVSSGGVSSAQLGRKFGFANAATDAKQVFEDPDLDVVVVTTRPDTHSSYVMQALRAGKHVFVEKPLVLKPEELDEIEAFYRSAPSMPLLGIGFNRRFAPNTQTAVQLLRSVHEPITMIATINAGEIPLDHWTHDPDIAGGRIIHEGCHFIDLLRHLAGAPIVDVQARMIGGDLAYPHREDKMTLTLAFANGAIGTVHYFSNGHRSFPKERIEVFAGGKILGLDNFKELRGYGWERFKRQRLWQQDKGHRACLAAFMAAVRKGEAAPIPFDEVVEVTRACFQTVAAARAAQRAH